MENNPKAKQPNDYKVFFFLHRHYFFSIFLLFAVIASLNAYDLLTELPWQDGPRDLCCYCRRAAT